MIELDDDRNPIHEIEVDLGGGSRRRISVGNEWTLPGTGRPCRVVSIGLDRDLRRYQVVVTAMDNGMSQVIDEYGTIAVLKVRRAMLI